MRETVREWSALVLGIQTLWFLWLLGWTIRACPGDRRFVPVMRHLHSAAIAVPDHLL